MSVEALTWAIKRKTGSQGKKLVLMCMANYANHRGILWYAQSTIAAQCELSVDTLQRRLAELEADGFLTKTERDNQNGKKGGRYIYRLMMAAETPTIDDRDVDDADIVPSKSTPQDAVSFSKTMPQLALDHTANGEKPHRTVAAQTVNIKPSLDKPLKKESGLAPGDDWPDDYFEILWDRYPPGRKTSKKAVRACLEKLRKRGVSFALIMAGVDRYAASRPDPKFTKAPEVWLNKECWEGETPVSNQSAPEERSLLFQIASGAHRRTTQ